MSGKKSGPTEKKDTTVIISYGKTILDNSLIKKSGYAITCIDMDMEFAKNRSLSLSNISRLVGIADQWTTSLGYLSLLVESADFSFTPTVGNLLDVCIAGIGVTGGVAGAIIALELELYKKTYCSFLDEITLSQFMYNAKKVAMTYSKNAISCFNRFDNYALGSMKTSVYIAQRIICQVQNDLINSVSNSTIGISVR